MFKLQYRNDYCRDWRDWNAPDTFDTFEAAAQEMQKEMLDDINNSYTCDYEYRICENNGWQVVEIELKILRKV